MSQHELNLPIYRKGRELFNDYPPGFILAAKDRQRKYHGVLPTDSGIAAWHTVIKGVGEDRTVFGEIPCEKNKAAPIQRYWLKTIRNRIIPLEKLLIALKISQRTWEGWESNLRYMPYHQVAKIALMIWEAAKNGEQHPSPKISKVKISPALRKSRRTKN